MHVIIEGTDGTGKTTLAKHLVEKLGASYHHSSAETDNDFTYHMNLLEKSQPQVLDRFQIGELIYPIIFGRESKLDFSSAAMLSRVEDVMTVVLYSSDEEFLRKRLQDRDQFVEEHVFMANKLFKMIADIFVILGIDVLLIDVSKNDPLRMVEMYL